MESLEKIIAKNIASKMEELNFDINDLVKESRLSRQTISGILNADRRARAKNLDDIAVALGTTRAALEADPSSRSDRAKLITKVIDFIPQLTPPQLKQLVEEIEKITQRSKSK